MTPLVIIVGASLGQYGGGHTATHCTGHGYCGFHHAYHQQAAFAADPYHLTQAVAGYIRQQAADAARAQAERDLSAKLDRIEATLKAQQAPNAGVPQGGIVPPPPTPAEVAAAPLATALNRCASCHTGDGSAGDTVIFEAPGKLATLDLWTRVKINEAMKSGKMPPRGQKVSPEERRVIADSIKADLAAISETLKD